MIHEDLSYRVIGCCIAVHQALGPRLLEQCYHNALYYELQASGFTVGYNVPCTVRHRGQIVGEYFADLVVEDTIILKLKAIKCLTEAHTAQVLNYLHIAHIDLGLLVNFHGPRLEWKRLVI